MLICHAANKWHKQPIQNYSSLSKGTLQSCGCTCLLLSSTHRPSQVNVMVRSYMANRFLPFRVVNRACKKDSDGTQ